MSERSRAETTRKKNAQALLGMLKIKHIEGEYGVNKPRTQKSEFQKSVLKEVFTLTKFPSRQTREDLALLLNHTPRGIQIWFQNQRNKLGLLDGNISPEDRQKKANEKKQTIDILILTNIVERNIQEPERDFWINFINYEPEEL